MEPEVFNVEITISHADELRKANRKKFDRLMDRLHSGLLDFPGVSCVAGPCVESTDDEKEEWDRIEREGKARQEQAVAAALADVLKEPEMADLVKSHVKAFFNSPENQETLARAVAGLGSK